MACGLLFALSVEEALGPSGFRILAVAVAIAAQVALPSVGFSQTDRVGVVTTLEGSALVARASMSAPLKFKDDVFVHDRISTGERSFVRVLLGGKATVTAREHSVIVITELPNASTITLSSGRIAVAVSKDKLKPGEVVHISTPNALATIRGTVVVAEVSPTWNGTRSVITVLRGLVDVIRIDPRTERTIGMARDVGALQTITVAGSSPAPLPRQTAISTDQAKRLSAEFTMVPQRPRAGSTEPVVKAAVQEATNEINAMLVPSGTRASANGSSSAKSAAPSGSGNGNSPANGSEGSSEKGSAVGNTGAGVTLGSPGNANGNGHAVGLGGGNGLGQGNPKKGASPGNGNPGKGAGKR